MKHLRSLSELQSELASWAQSQEQNPSLRLNGKLKGGAPQHCLVFPVQGFFADDYQPSKEDVASGVWKDSNGTDFNARFGLSGDTQLGAIQEFLKVYAEHDGDIRKIFRPGIAKKGNGTPGKLKLYLNSSATVEGWNCLKYVK